MNDVTSDIVVVEGDASIPMFIPSGVTGTVNAFSNTTELAASILDLGTICQTAGFDTAGDGGGALYVVEEEPYLWGFVTLANGYFANLVNHEKINAIALGFKSDGTDNGPLLNSLLAIKRLSQHYYEPLTIVFPPGDFVFSPVTCDVNAFNIEGTGTPNNSKGNYTRFLPAGNQEFILKLGRDDATTYASGSKWMYKGNSIKRIRFSSLKYGQDGEGDHLTDTNYWKISKAVLIIGRLTQSKFEDLFFWTIHGTSISITGSYELSFYNTYIYHTVCLENGALNFAEDIGNQQQSWASDNSAIYFDYIAIEGCAGDCFTFDRLCDTYNTMIGVIDYEDYRTNAHLGTVWTSDTWLPDGYDAPDAELAIFHFKERCTTDQTVVSQIQWQQPSTRSFMYDGTCYAKTTLMKVDGYVYDASLNVGILDLRTFSPRGPINTILSPSPYIGEHVNLYIGKVFNNSRNAVRPVGYVRTYDVGIDHASTKKFDFNIYRMADYKSVYDSTAVPDYAERFELEEIQTYSPYSNKYVWIGPAMGKGSTEAYSYNGICALPPLPSILPGTGNHFGASPIKIVIIGEILKIRAYLPVYDELICAVNSLEDDSRLKTFNLQEYQDIGWQWLTLDLSRYVNIGYLTFAMRPNSTSEPLLDVYYFEVKKENDNV